MIQWSIAIVEIVVLIAILLLLYFPGFKLDPEGNARLYPRAIRERYYQIHGHPAGSRGRGGSRADPSPSSSSPPSP